MTGPKCNFGARENYFSNPATEDQQEFFYQFLKKSGYSQAEIEKALTDPELRQGDDKSQCEAKQPNSAALLLARNELMQTPSPRLMGTQWFKTSAELLSVPVNPLSPALQRELQHTHQGLAQALELRAAGKLKASERQIKKTLLKHKKAMKTLGSDAEHPAAYYYFGLLYLQLGQSKDLRRKNKWSQVAYEKAQKFLDLGIKKHPQAFSLYLVRAQVHHGMGQFARADTDYRQAVALEPGVIGLHQAFHQELNALTKAFEQGREKATATQHWPQVQLYLMNEIQLRQILGQEHRLEKLSVELEQVNQRVAVVKLIEAMELIGKQGHSLQGLGGEAKSLAQQYLVEKTDRKGRVKVSLSATGMALPPDQLVDGLKRVLEAQVHLQWEQLAATETEPVKKAYYGLKLDLSDGNFAAAQLKLRHIKALTETLDAQDIPTDKKAAQDLEELKVIREEALGLLQKFALAALEKLLQANDGLATQRLSNFELNYYDKKTGEANEALLQALKYYVTSDQAYTLEEAVQVLQADHERLQKNFAENPVVQKGWMVGYAPPRARHGSEDWKAQRGDFNELVNIFNQDKNDPRLRDPDAFSHLGFRKIEGGTLVTKGWSEFGTRIVIGTSGGFITVGENIYEFPPSDKERFIILNHSRINLHGLKMGEDYHQHVNHPLQFPDGYGTVTQDYKNGHPATLQTLVKQWETLKFRDRDLFNLFELQSDAGLKKLSDPATRDETLLDAAKDLWHRNGSYAQTAEILEGLFQEDLTKALQKIPEEKIASIIQEVKKERSEIAKEIKESLKNFQEQQPKKFAARFPQGGPEAKEFEAMVDQGVQARISHRIRKEAFVTLDTWYESGEMKGSLARQAWEIFEDMEDPLDKWDNLSSQSWDRVFDEVVITAVTLPATLGVGTLVRSGLSGTAFALRMAATGGARSLLMRGGILLTGAITEGLVQETLTHSLFGTPWKLKNVGVTTLMSLAFHGGGRLSGKYLSKVGMDEAAIKMAQRNFRPWRHKQVGAFGVTMGTQTVLATAFTYAEDVLHPGAPKRTLTERVLGSAARMVAFHYGTKALNLATGNIALDAEMLSQARFKEAREAYQRGIERGLSPEQALHESVQWAQGVKLDPEDGSVYYPLADEDLEIISQPLSTQEKETLKVRLDETLSLDGAKFAETEGTGVIDYNKLRSDALMEDFFAVNAADTEVTKNIRVQTPEDNTVVARPAPKAKPMYEEVLLDLEPGGKEISLAAPLSLRRAKTKPSVPLVSADGHVLKGSQGQEKVGVMKFPVDGQEMQLVTDFALSNNVYFRFAKDRGRFETVTTAAQADFEIKLTDGGDFLWIPLGEADAKVFKSGNRWQPVSKDGAILSDGAFYKIGKRAFHWESSEGSAPELTNFVGFKKFSEGFRKDKTQLLSVVETGAKDQPWGLDSVQPDQPNQAHIPLVTAWEHPSQKDLSRQYASGVAAEDLIMGTYMVKVKGRQRFADIIQNLEKSFGSKLAPIEALRNSDRFYFLKQADGKGQIKIEISRSELQLVDAKGAQLKLDSFMAMDAPVLREWAAENSTRGIYAQKLLSLVGEKRLGKVLSQIETATTPEAKSRAQEELTLLVAHLDDTAFLIPHYQVLHEARILRDDPRIGLVLGMEGSLELGRMIRTLDSLGDGILHANSSSSHEYQGLHRQLQEWVQETGLVVTHTKIPSSLPELIAEPARSGTQGAGPKDHRDLRIFTPQEIQDLQLSQLGVKDLDVLWHGPEHPQYTMVLVAAFNHLLRRPQGEAGVDQALVRLVSAFRHLNLYDHTSLTWVEHQLEQFGRNTQGLRLAPENSGSLGDQVSLTVTEAEFLGLQPNQSYDPIEIVSAVRSKSRTMDVIDGVWQFIPTEAGHKILYRVLKAHGGYLQNHDAALAHYLQGMVRDPQLFSPQFVEAGKGDSDGSEFTRRSAVAAPLKPKHDTDFLQLPTLPGLGQDLLSFNGAHPTQVGQIKGMTTAMEKVFEQGGSVIRWHDGNYQLIELPSGAHTIMTRVVDREVYLAYLTWREQAGFARLDLRQGRQVWLGLQKQARDLGVSVSWGDKHGKIITDTEMAEYSGMFPYLSSLLKLLPSALLKDPNFKGIRLHTSRKGAAQAGAYDDGYIYLYSGASQGSRRHFAALFLHEMGHVVEQYYTQEALGAIAVPDHVKRQMRQSHATLVQAEALIGLDWYQGPASRKSYQGSYQEFLAEMNLIYLSAGPQLRRHIRNLPEGSVERIAWEYIYSELKERIYGGKEYSFSDGAMAGDHPLSISFEEPTLRLVVEPTTGVQLNPYFFLLADNQAQLPRRGELGDLKAGNQYGSHWASTHEGIGYKPKNEDGVVQGENWALVLDGMGGEGDGDRASHAAGVAIYDFMNDPSQGGDLVAAFNYAHAKIPETSQGATVAVAHRIITHPDQSATAEVVHVGDANLASYARNASGQYERVFETQDQSWVAMMRSAGHLADTLAMRIHPRANTVLGGLGKNLQANPVRNEIPLEPGTVLISASDGFKENLSNAEVLYLIDQHQGNAQSLQRALMGLAMEKMNRLALAKKILQGNSAEDGYVQPGFLTADGKTIPVAVLDQTPGLFIDSRGTVYDSTGQVVDKYKADNISVHVYLHDVPGAKSPKVKESVQPVAAKPMVSQVETLAPTILLPQLGRFRIGRDTTQGNHLVLNSAKVSRVHAEIVSDGKGQFWLDDLTSSNGTYRNGVRLKPGLRHALKEGDRIIFGDREFEVRWNAPRQVYGLTALN